MVREREASGYSEFMPRKIRIRARMPLREIEEIWCGAQQVGAVTEARQPARFTAAGIFASPGYVSAGQVEFCMWVQAGGGIVADGERWQS